ncbi:CarD family transcriptional regulator [candidate division CSSED10-310 bacterium]|uniref:CarD family transcriptional regulator n=1 Tax=candidate division CSSED10-310 bacterium TaxID=2855610 RepID=A0ABV6Z107_UNCC1
MFSIGDKIVYPANGVGVIDDIKVMEISGTTQEFFIIRILADNSKIMIPKDNAVEVGIRNLVSDEELEGIFDILKSDSPQLELSTKWSKRQREYQEIIKNGSIYEITKIMKILSDLQLEKELSYSEKKIFENVKGMIVSEIAQVKDIDPSEAETMIEQFMEH